jgi:cysteine synthase
MSAIRAVWPRRWRKDRPEWRDLGQPVRQRGQPAGPCRNDGPEIWDQTGGKVDGFICAVGSGGTLAGVAMALQPKGVKIGLADPEGAALHSFYTTGKLKRPARRSPKASGRAASRPT